LDNFGFLGVCLHSPGWPAVCLSPCGIPALCSVVFGRGVGLSSLPKLETSSQLVPG
jgi:hypothetical protein